MTENILGTILEGAKKNMKKACDHLESELAKLRTGRAHASLLDDIRVDHYGSSVPISQIANISIPDARTIFIKPWEKKVLSEIEKDIRSSKLGLNPQNNGDSLVLKIPQQTEEGRKEVVKKAKNEVEKIKMSVRNCRRDANAVIKKLEKEKKISKDEMKKSEDEVQKLTDDFIKNIDLILEKKEKEIMKI